MTDVDKPPVPLTGYGPAGPMIGLGQILGGIFGQAAPRVVQGVEESGETNPVLLAFASATKLLLNLGYPGFWKRTLTGAAGILLVWWGILIIIGSLDITKRAISAAATRGASEL